MTQYLNDSPDPVIPLSVALTFLSFFLRDVAVSPVFSCFALHVIGNPFFTSQYPNVRPLPLSVRISFS